MHKFIDKIKKFESKPFIIENFLNKEEVGLFQKLYEELPIEINNFQCLQISDGWGERYLLGKVIKARSPAENGSHHSCQKA